MDDFFKNIKENLEHRSEPDFDEKAWGDMVSRLDRSSKNDSFPFRYILLLLALLLSLLGNGLFIADWYLEGNNSKKQTTQRDTVIKGSIILKTDTIIQTQVIHKFLNTYLPHSGNYLSANYTKLSNKYKFSSFDKIESILASSNEKENKYDFFNYLNQFKQSSSLNLSSIELGSQNDIPIYIVDSISTLEFGVKQLSTKPVLDFEDYLALWKLEKKSRPFIDLQYYDFALYGGWINPLLESPNARDGEVFGGSFGIGLSNRLNIKFSGELHKVDFETRTINENIGIPFVAPPDDNFVFRKADLMQSSLQLSAITQYNLLSGTKVQPFIGIGFSTFKEILAEVNYEFENEPLQVDWVFQKELTTSERWRHYSLFNLGINIGLSEHILWNFQSTYRTNWKTRSIDYPNQLTIESGFSYRINRK